MSRGFRASEQGGSSANGALAYRIGQIKTWAERSRNQVAAYKGPAYAAFAGSKALERRIKRAEKEAAVWENCVKTYEKLYESGLKGDLKGMGPKEKGKSKAEEFGGKLLAAQALLAQGVKIGPNRSEITDDQLMASVKGVEGREHVVFFDANGRYMFGMTGEKGRIKMWAPTDAAPHPLGYTNHKGSDWHNHPIEPNRLYGFPPSASDVMGLFVSGANERRVSAKEGTYTLRITDKTRARLDSMSSAKGVGMIASTAKAIWNSHFQRSLTEGGPLWDRDQTQADNTMRYSVKNLTTAAAAIGIEFEFKPNPGYEHLRP